ncbi:MAG: hypothetical protein OXU66_07845 [Gammaproteobacteria bacterium]|nr:hypothetical protein [Gammaproteobacteria bacterium]MDD9958839.1 hypothetical protein [Gammaproteobacteria bacterium]
MNPQEPQSDDSVITPRRRSSPDHKPTIRKIYRARTRLIVCLWTLPVYILTVWILLSNRQPIDLFMFFYFALCAGFWLDMAWRKCPACDKQFYVKSILLNLITHKCVHCSLDMAAAEPVVEDKIEF